MAFAPMLAAAPIRWADPATWPWVVWVWLAFLLAGWAKPIWRWLQRQRAQSWPTVQGRIESVEVKQKKLFRRGRAPGFIAELAYSYALEGHYYGGYYQREIGSEQEAWEFVRDLQGKPVVVSHNPRKLAKSMLSEDALTVLLNARPPAPEGQFRVPVFELPAWAKPLLWPFIVLSGVGLGLSLWVHLGAVAGRRVAPEAFFSKLNVGIFVVWFPAVFVAIKRVGNNARKDFWKLVLRGSPEWMRYMVYGFFAYAIVNFAIFFFQAPQGSSGANPPAAVWRGFSGHWMAFYSAALAILYSAAVGSEDQS
jgi:hypothetical protein